MSRIRTIPLLLLSAALAGCASTAGAERAFVAPTDETVLSGLEPANSGRGQHIYVQNLSTENIVVTSVFIRDCQNIKNRCESARMKLPVYAGQTRRIVTVQPDSENLAYHFRYSWTWEPVRPAPAAPR